ncbi:uncharacterized protein LOC133388503 isoform X2 [Rhineura floridana]|uniref:uncharacterized protein LOC133388503 isoform X2 n=1 Tax=Rhineura floridana TaxID=261503 RepID=UPI002AC8064C|nr:uncharacterized protein LOC133388503 isoform X2 [Rhineura floridana]
MGKCSKLWSKQNQSAQIAEYTRAQCGVYLKVPNRTRWNSTFDALKQLHELLSTVPLKMHAIMDRCSLSRITAAEIEVVQEYTEIMEPLAQSLDILQLENGMFMGYLLPTLCDLDRKLEGLENKPERYTMEALLKAEIKMGVLNEDSDQSSDKDQEGDDLEDDFFNFLPQGKKSAVDTAEEELVRYLRSPSREVSSLHGFPRVLRCFLQHNTGMPSSAAVERLFSTGGNVMTVKRHSLSDMLFEHLVLLRHNRNIL